MRRKLNRQAVLTKVWKHLRKQNAKCVADLNTSRCLYRGPNGMMCAIGALIPDEVYKAEFENDDAAGICNRSEQIRNLFTKEVTPTFLNTLQIVHDCDPVSNWEESLKKFAEKENLTPLPARNEAN